MPGQLNVWGRGFGDTYHALNKGSHAAHAGDLGLLVGDARALASKIRGSGFEPMHSTWRWPRRLPAASHRGQAMRATSGGEWCCPAGIGCADLVLRHAQSKKEPQA
jgi:hypothetical protein